MSIPHAVFGEFVQTSHVPAIIAGAATQIDPIFVAPCKCVVLEIAIVPQAPVTGATGTCKNLNILNVGAAGLGSTEVANYDLITGHDLVAGDLKVIPLNTTYEDGVAMAAGDVLVLQTELVGGGVAMPTLLVAIGARENGE